MFPPYYEVISFVLCARRRFPAGVTGHVRWAAIPLIAGFLGTSAPLMASPLDFFSATRTIIIEA